jgi:3-oxoacyl-[acyl-carrier protein] reductase
MDFLLKNKIALITGATQGIGAATAYALAGEGADLIISGRNEQKLSAQKLQLQEKFDNQVHVVPGDLTSTDECSRIVKNSLNMFPRIDILVNSAGASQGGLFWEIPEEVWQDSINLKLMGTVRMMKAIIPIMIKNKYGRIVNVVGSTGGQPQPRLLPGSAANAALLAITTGLGQELGKHNIVINALNPGPTRTERWTNLMSTLASKEGVQPGDIEKEYVDQIPTQKLANPDEIGRLATFLASDLAANITGSSIIADGGWTKGTR